MIGLTVLLTIAVLVYLVRRQRGSAQPTAGNGIRKVAIAGACCVALIAGLSLGGGNDSDRATHPGDAPAPPISASAATTAAAPDKPPASNDKPPASNGKPPASNDKPAERKVAKKSEASDDKRFEQCRTKLIKAQKLGVVYDIQWDGKTYPRVMVGPTFFNMALDAKQGFADTLNCFFMVGEHGKYIEIEFLDWRTGKSIGRYSYGRVEMD
jgi:hypothetical protein